ncbi:hypothetical protein B6U99_06145 [Candidatus Geothermarchaeota archaeon ex4572_27]|nr:MAG: hypothetical protein B6U99_06145 [Candidatus Geothermarchaeota archaeon ex4572_27]
MLALASMLVRPATAVSIELEPASPKVGDTVTLTVRGAPGSAVHVSVSYEAEVPVEGGRYELRVSSLEVPLRPNRFTVVARGVEDLHVSVKTLFWVTKSVKARGGEARLTQSNVPPGVYNVIIHGRAQPGREAVALKFVAETWLKLGVSGEASLSYDTSTLPPGTFTIEADGARLRAQLAKPMRRLAVWANATVAIIGSAIRVVVEAEGVEQPITLHVDGRAIRLAGMEALVKLDAPGRHVIYATAGGVESNRLQVYVAPLSMRPPIGLRLEVPIQGPLRAACDLYVDAWNRLLELGVLAAWALTVAAVAAAMIALVRGSLRGRPPWGAS